MMIGVHRVLLMQKMDIFFAIEFISVTVDFGEKWGLEMVHTRLGCPINNVRINTGMQNIYWSSIHYINEDGTLHPPNITDELGRAPKLPTETKSVENYSMVM